MNLANHLNKVHKLNSMNCDKYGHYLNQNPVIPKCYTRIENNKAVLLESEQLETVRMDKADEIEKDRENLEYRKELKTKILALKERLRCLDDEEEKESTSKELRATQLEYKMDRFRDEREYPPKVKLWRDAFQQNVEKRAYKNPTIIVSMAMDVLLPWVQVSHFWSRREKTTPYSDILFQVSFNVK